MLHNLQLEFLEAILSDTASEQLQPISHLSIYRNNIHATFLQCLHEIYPLIVKLVGADYFPLLANDYIAQYPSRSSNLHDYGEYFSDFIAQYQPLKNLIYLSEVAAFEWQCHILNFAASAEGTSLSLLESFPPEMYPSLRVNLHPAARLMKCYYPILKIIDLCQGTITQEINLDEGGIYLLLYRREFDIQLIPLSEPDYVFLQSLSQGETLEEALTRSELIDPNFNFTEKLSAWVENKLIVEFLGSK